MFWGKAPNPGKKTTSKIIVPEQKELYFLGKLPALAKKKNQKLLYSSGTKAISFGKAPNPGRNTASKIKVPEKKKCKKAGSTFIVGKTGTIFFGSVLNV